MSDDPKAAKPIDARTLSREDYKTALAGVLSDARKGMNQRHQANELARIEARHKAR